MAGQVCPLCSEPIEPGDNVAFQRGDLLHLRCYTERRMPSAGDESPPEDDH